MAEYKRRSVGVFEIERYLRTKLDRTKYPFDKPEVIRDKQYGSWEEAAKACAKLEKKNPEYLYIPRVTFIENRDGQD